MNAIIDTDPGIDDALALFLALNSPELNIKAIVASYGNVSVRQGVFNILKILEITAAGNPSFNFPPVIKGAKHPFKRLFVKRDYRVHGRNGLGNYKLTRPCLKPADEKLSGILKKSKKISYISLGPLTNLAKLILGKPGLIYNLKEIILMGGAIFVSGNVNRFAEFNVYCDPESAKIVFNCGIPITVVGLDVTHRTLLTEKTLELINISNPRLDFVDKICRYYINFHKKYRGMKGCFLHDPLAIAVAIDRSIVKTRKLSVDVEIEDRVRFGQTFVKKDGRPNADVCVEFDNDRFMKLLRQRVFKEEV